MPQNAPYHKFLFTIWASKNFKLVLIIESRDKNVFQIVGQYFYGAYHSTYQLLIMGQVFLVQIHTVCGPI